MPGYLSVCNYWLSLFWLTLRVSLFAVHIAYSDFSDGDLSGDENAMDVDLGGDQGGDDGEESTAGSSQKTKAGGSAMGKGGKSACTGGKKMVKAFSKGNK